MAGTDPFADFNGHARSAVTHAQQEAGAAQLAHIGTEHLLVGLLLETEGRAARLLRRGGITPAEVRASVEAQATRTQRIVLSDLMASSRLEDVFRHAREEARSSGLAEVGTEHLLLGLLEEPGCVAARVLEEMGVHIDTVREELASSA